MLTIDDVKKQLKDKYQAAIKNFDNPYSTQLFVDIDKSKVREISNEIIKMGGRYLVSVGYDNIERDKTLGLIHNFSLDRDDLFVCVRTAAPVDNPEFDSITPDIPNAGWSEREYIDLLCQMATFHTKADLSNIASAALFEIIVEKLCDDFEDLPVEVYSRVMCQVISFCRSVPAGLPPTPCTPTPLGRPRSRAWWVRS